MNSRFKERLLKHGSNVSWLIGEQGLNILLSLVSIPLMARWLGPENYGIITAYTAAVAIISPLASGGIDSLLAKKLVEEPDEERQALGNAALILLVGNAAAVLVALGYVIFRWQSRNNIEELAIGLAVVSILLFRFQMIPIGYLQSKIIVGRSSKARIIGGAAVHGGRIALVAAKAPAAAFGWLVSLGTGLLTFLLLLKTAFSSGMPLPSGWRYSLSEAWTWRKSSFVLGITGMATMVYRSGDQLLVAEMLGNEELGYYGGAVRLAEFAGLLSIAINTTMFPLLVRAKKMDAGIYEGRVLELFRLQNFITLGGAVFTTIFAPLLVRIYYGAEFSQTAPILAVYIWTVVLVAQISTKTQVLLAEGEYGVLFRWAMLTAVISLGLNFLLLIPYFQVQGAVAASLISYGFLAFGVSFLDPKIRWVGKIQIKALLTPLPNLRRLR